jgi:hypothetical protein
VAEEDQPGELGHNLGKELDSLGDDLFVLGGEPGDVPAGMREARREASADRVDQDDDDDWDAARRLLGRPGCRNPGRDDDLALEPDEVGGKRRVALGLSFRPAVLGSIEPFRSAKRTVTCLRSPSRAAFEARIFSARCWGV